MDIKKLNGKTDIDRGTQKIQSKTQHCLLEKSDTAPDESLDGIPDGLSGGVSDTRKASRRISSDITAEELRSAEEFLSGYRHGCRMLACERYGRRYMVGFPSSSSSSSTYENENEDDLSAQSGFDDRLDESVIRARMYRVRLFVSELKCDSNSQLMLYWHYVRGISVAGCASLLGVSRAGAFRIRRRAIEAAARALRSLK